MKILSFILFLLFAQFSISQIDRKNFASIDRKVKTIDANSLDELAAKLFSPEYTQAETVRAIFRWITEHIDYQVSRYTLRQNRGRSFNIQVAYEDTLPSLPTLDERVGNRVVKEKTGFCESYSRLFKALCRRAGIPCELVHGYVRTEFNRSGRFGNNHAWNAIYLENNWYLLDVTWASGFITLSNEFVRRFQDFYFLTPPEDFIKDHYPEDLSWTLLKDPPLYKEFKKSPYKYGGFVKAGITSYFPSVGTIEAGIGDSITLLITSNRGISNLLISDSPVEDSLLAIQSCNDENTIDRSHYEYQIPADAGNWLYVYCNDVLVLRYRLIKKTDLAIAD